MNKSHLINDPVPSPGDRFLYYEDETVHIFQCFSTKEMISSAHLRAAADAMAERCPYFIRKREIRNGIYALRQTKDTFPVLQNEGYVLFNDERNCGFLLLIAYGGDTVYVSIHHALTDAVGAVRFTLSLAAEYLRRATGKELHVPGELCPGSKPGANEYVNPYRYAVSVDEKHSMPLSDGFFFEKEKIGVRSRRLRVYIPAREILSLSTEAQSSVSSVLAMILIRTIRKLYPSEDRPFIVNCPVDMRIILGCKDTLQNCCTDARFVYPMTFQNMPLARQLSCLKEMLKLQISEEYLLQVMEKKKTDFECIVRQADTIEDIKTAYAVGRNSTPTLTYQRVLNLGDIAPYIENFDTYCGARGATGLYLVSYCIKDKCILSLSNILKTDEAFSFFLDALKDLSFPYTVIDKEGFEAEDYHRKNWLNA